MSQLESALERLRRRNVPGLKKGVGMEQVAGYFRVSRARDGMKAPELYLEEIERYCRYKRLKLGKVFSDIDFSGRKGSKARPGLDALIGSRHRFSAVVVPKLSRFGRSMTHLMQLFDTFEDDGIALVFLDLGLDTSTSQGRLLRNVMAAFAEFEGDVRSDYSRAAHDHRARRGLPNGGWAPFGYRRQGDKYVAQPGEAEIVTEIFDLYRQGQSMFAIGRLLNERGTPSPKGRLWSKPTLRKMLENPHYAALRRYGDALVEAAWKPLITRETWEAVQERLAAITNRGVARPPEGLYLLSGLIECGVCGTTLHHRTKQDRVPGQYICRGDRGADYCRGGASRSTAPKGWSWLPICSATALLGSTTRLCPIAPCRSGRFGRTLRSFSAGGCSALRLSGSSCCRGPKATVVARACPEGALLKFHGRFAKGSSQHRSWLLQAARCAV
jgi:DNA invertase Pin-like site-specific DNA recombinase